MGEARRRSEKGLPPKKSKRVKDKNSRIFSLNILNKENQEKFFSITKTGAWIGIFLLIIFWLTVRFIGPAAGWWNLADAR